MIELDKFSIGADEYGSINLYKEEYGEEISLGEVDEDGKYNRAWWMKSEENVEETVRTILTEQYFNERKAHIEREQEEWPERYVQFMELDSEGRKSFQEYEKIGSDPEDEGGLKGRYLNQQGNSLNGIYQKSLDTYVQKHVFNRGKLVHSWKTPLGVNINNEHLSNIHLSGIYTWQWIDQKLYTLNYCQYKSFLENKIFATNFFSSNKDLLKKQVSKIESSNASYLIFPHLQDENKFRVVATRDSKLADLFDYEVYKNNLLEVMDAARSQKDIWSEEQIESFNNLLDSVSGESKLNLENFDKESFFVYLLMQYPTDFLFDLTLKGCNP